MENKIKLVEAFVSSNKKYKEGTITVIVKRRFKHALYEKIIKASKKYIAEYSDKGFLEINQKVWITFNTAPISKRKRCRIVKIDEVTKC